MKKLVIAATLATSIAAPAFAQSAASFAIMHFNMDEDSVSEQIMVPTGDGPMVVDLAPGSTLADVFAHFNMDFDTPSDMRGGAGVTIITGHTGIAEDIFRMIMEEQEDMGN